MLDKLKSIIIIGLIIICGLGFYETKKLEKERDNLLSENVTLNDKIKQIVTISNGKVKIVYRDKDRIITRYVYISPSNGSATTITTTDNDDVIIKNNWYGFACTPLVGMVAGNGVGGELGARFFYVSKVGLYGGLNKIGIKNVEPTIGIDYHISWGVLQNSAIGIFCSPSNVGLSFHSFL